MSEDNIRMFRDNHGCRRFVGKNAIVTAGTAGIGLAACHRLCSEGARVFLCSRKQDNVDEAVKELQSKYGKDFAAGVPCNVTKPGDLENFIQAAQKYFNGKIHIVVSNVGVNPTISKIVDMSESIYDKLFEANVRSHWKLIKLVTPHLVHQESSILLVSFFKISNDVIRGVIN